MKKWLDDDGYKERLKQFMAEINPKPSATELEKLFQKMKERRGE